MEAAPGVAPCPTSSPPPVERVHPPDAPVARQSLDGRVAAFTNSRWRHRFRERLDAGIVDRGRVAPALGRQVEDVDAVALREHGLSIVMFEPR